MIMNLDYEASDNWVAMQNNWIVLRKKVFFYGYGLFVITMSNFKYAPAVQELNSQQLTGKEQPKFSYKKEVGPNIHRTSTILFLTT